MSRHFKVRKKNILVCSVQSGCYHQVCPRQVINPGEQRILAKLLTAVLFVVCKSQETASPSQPVVLEMHVLQGGTEVLMIKTCWPINRNHYYYSDQRTLQEVYS